jgi:hypothetical protein
MSALINTLCIQALRFFCILRGESGNRECFLSLHFNFLVRALKQEEILFKFNPVDLFAFSKWKPEKDVGGRHLKSRTSCSSFHLIVWWCDRAQTFFFLSFCLVLGWMESQISNIYRLNSGFGPSMAFEWVSFWSTL